MHNHGEPSCQCDDGFFLPPTLGNVHRPCLQPRPFLHAGQHDLRGSLPSNITYGIPPASPEPGTTLLIDSGDNRVLQVAGIGDTLVGQLTTVCNFTPGTPNESCALTPRVSVFIGSSGQLLASLPENTFSGLGNNIFVHQPGIATNFALQSATTWEFNGTGHCQLCVTLEPNRWRHR